MQYLSIVPRLGRDLLLIAVEDVAEVAQHVLLAQLVITHVHLVVCTHPRTPGRLPQDTSTNQSMYAYTATPGSNPRTLELIA